MLNIDVARIASWHAHVYFDAGTRDAARAFREIVSAQFGDRVALGRFHERPVGPHPCWSFQIAFPPTQFAEVVGWLTLIIASSTCSCIRTPTTSCATIETARYGSAPATCSTCAPSAVDDPPSSIIR